jgi:hypothetical protein
MGSRKRNSPLETYTLVASIMSIERSYSISEERGYRRVDDEATLLLKGAIKRISARYHRHHGKEIEIQLLCARSFDRDNPSGLVEKPFLMSVSFRGAVAGVGAYLPSDAFWALADMIKSKEVCHVEIDFGSSRYGFAELLNLNFTHPAGLRESLRRILFS